MNSALLRHVTLPPAQSASSTGSAPIGTSSALLVDGRIAWLGAGTDEPGVPAGTTVIDAGGALLLPAFADAHVHVTETGLSLDGVALADARSAGEILDRVARASARRPGQPVIGYGWDELRLAGGRLPTAAELDQAAHRADVYLSRVDVHSALVSASLSERLGLAALEGWDGIGRIERDAHHAARHATRFDISTDQRRALQERALAAAAAAGIAEVHECAAPHIAPEQDLRDLLELAASPVFPGVIGYWGERAESAEQARAIADRVAGGPGRPLAGLAGDLMVDGSFGSHTAAVHDDYLDRPGHRGHLYLDAAAIAAHVQACTRAGLQAGFHVIGDRAADTMVEGLRRAAAGLGPGGAASLRRARHRIEHLEGVAPASFGTLAECGVTAGMQPLFDAEWGGVGRMYEHRLGPDRTRRLNPFAGLHAAGVRLAFGSDSPVTPFAPWAAIRAAVHHRTPEHRLDPTAAFAAHLPADAPGRDRVNPARLAAGDPANVALWDTPSVDDALGRMPAAGPEPACVLTLRSGRVIHRSGGLAGL